LVLPTVDMNDTQYLSVKADNFCCLNQLCPSGYCVAASFYILERVKILQKVQLIKKLPGSCAKGSNPSLQQTPEEDRRVLTSEDEVEDADCGEKVDDQTGDNGYHVHAQLLGSHRQVWQLHDLSSYQAHYAKW